jgi:glycosyltransferase involved in cell wall biosynthesis
MFRQSISYQGQDIALNAFALPHPNPGARLVFVGRSNYEADFLEGMKEKFKLSNISGKVHFTGMVERAEVLAWLHHSDIPRDPCALHEFGSGVAESWISDTPVIQSDVVDPNLVVEGENGWLFESENDEALKIK